MDDDGKWNSDGATTIVIKTPKQPSMTKTVANDDNGAITANQKPPHAYKKMKKSVEKWE